MGFCAAGVVANDVANRAADHVVLQGIGDGRLDEARLVATIEALAFEAQAEERPLGSDLLGHGRIGIVFHSLSPRRMSGRLPGAWKLLCHLNPFFYMIDGFRYGFIGVADGSLAPGLIIMAVSNAVLLILAYRMIATGYKIKS